MGPFVELSKEGAFGGRGRVSFQRQVRTSKKTGKVARKNFRVDFEADSLVVSTSAREVNAAFAAIVKRQLIDQFDAISEDVSPATKERRDRHFANPHTRWAKRRYGHDPKRFGVPSVDRDLEAGGAPLSSTTRRGRINGLRELASIDRVPGGLTMPDGGTSDRYRMLNDSGRLKNNLRLQLRRTSASSGRRSVLTLNFPANRVDPRTGGDISTVINALQEHVPLLAGGVGRGAGAGKAQQAIREAIEAMSAAAVDNTQEAIARRLARLRAIKVRLLRQAARAVLGG